jgi:hypothetical protein
MRQTHDLTLIRNTIILTLAALLLSGCLGGSGGDAAPAVEPPPVNTNSAPRISGNPATAVTVGDAYSFAPTASDADGDSLTYSIANMPDWASFDSATGELSGQPTLGDIGTYSNISISVSDGTASASLSPFTITVNQMSSMSATLSWTAPTQNEDGSALEDLAGYKIYWGTTPGVYPNSVTIDTIGTTTYVVENLSPGTYEFVATAYNTSGIESRYSNTATKVLQ